MKFLKWQKNVTSQKLKAIEQSHLDARFATSESTQNNQLQGRELQILRKFKLKFSNLFFEKIKESAISRKLQQIEQSDLGARFATPESNLTAPPPFQGSEFHKI